MSKNEAQYGKVLLRAFRAGWDTLELAKKFHLTEPEVYSFIHRAREAEREADPARVSSPFPRAGLAGGAELLPSPSGAFSSIRQSKAPLSAD